MFNDIELSIIESKKVHGFGAILMGIAGITKSVRRTVDRNRNDDREHLRSIHEKLSRIKFGFDDDYLNKRDGLSLNPLEYKQQAWELLSPLITEYLARLRHYIDGATRFDGSETIRYLDEGNGLVDKWLIISDLFAEKMTLVGSKKFPSLLEAWGILLEEALPDYVRTHPIWLAKQYDEILRKQDAVKQLIHELSSIQF